MNDSKIAHLSMIQGVIDRMAGNSAMAKGWAIAIVAATFAITGGERAYSLIVAAIVTFVFWLLDGYYLSLERAYRKLYDDVRMRKEGDIDFAMSASADGGKDAWAFFAVHNLAVYLVLAISVATIGLAAANGEKPDKDDATGSGIKANQAGGTDA